MDTDKGTNGIKVKGELDSKIQPEDCLNCKIIGSATMGALALYWNHLRLTTPKNARVNRIFLGTMATGFAGLSVFRLFY